MRRVGEAIVTAGTWAVLWGVIAVLIGWASTMLPGDPLGWFLDPWIALAMPGFIAGGVFFLVLWVAEGSRGIHHAPFPRVALWGMLTGLLVGVFPFVTGTPTDRVALPVLMAWIIGSATALSVISAMLSVLFIRVWAARAPRPESTRPRN